MKKRLFAASAIALCSLMPTQEASAQSFLDKLNTENVKDVVEDLASKVIDFSIEGKWAYTGSAIKLDSDKTLSDLAAVAASSTIEKKFNEQLEKTGIKAGSLHFHFLEDKTMSILIKDKTYKGTYTYNKETGELKMKIAKAIPLTTQVEVRRTEFAILFKADAVLTLVKSLSGKTSNEYIETACDLIKNYDGMRIGFNFKEQ